MIDIHSMSFKVMLYMSFRIMAEETLLTNESPVQTNKTEFLGYYSIAGNKHKSLRVNDAPTKEAAANSLSQTRVVHYSDDVVTLSLPSSSHTRQSSSNDRVTVYADDVLVMRNYYGST